MHNCSQLVENIVAIINKQLPNFYMVNQDNDNHYKGKKLLTTGWYHVYKASICLDVPVLPNEYVLTHIQTDLLNNNKSFWHIVSVEMDENGFMDIFFYSVKPIHTKVLDTSEKYAFDMLVKSILDQASKIQAVRENGGLGSKIFRLAAAHINTNEKVLSKVTTYFKNVIGLSIELFSIEDDEVLEVRITDESGVQITKEEIKPETNDKSIVSIGGRFTEMLAQIEQLSMLAGIATTDDIKQDIKNKMAPLVKNICTHALNITELREYKNLNSILEYIEYLNQLLSMRLVDKVIINNHLNILVAKALLFT